MLDIRKVGKRFDNDFLALQGLDLSVAAGEVLGIVGGSGCGKSTLLRLVAGLDQPTEGSVMLDGERVKGPHPCIGVVFQEPRLMPWLDIADNVAFGLTGTSTERRRALVAEAIRRVGLDRFAGALPRQLSGGMAQRVAIARALVTKPSVLLLDEPFSALDALTRQDLQDHLAEVWAYDRPTMILVTHDIEEALMLSDRVAVMGGHPGRILRELAVDLPRPRDRDDPKLRGLRHTLVGDLRVGRAILPPPSQTETEKAMPMGRSRRRTLMKATYVI